MNQQKRQNIEEQLAAIEKRLAAGEYYLKQGVNVEGTSWLHLDDWRGQSGHPSWVKNYMIPSLIKKRAALEKVMDRIEERAKDKNLTQPKRTGRRKAPKAIKHA